MQPPLVIFAVSLLLGACTPIGEDRKRPFFDAYGNPKAAGREWASHSGRQLIRGREILFPNELLESSRSGCVTVSMIVGKDGVPVSYTALDAIAFDERSRQDAVAAVIASLTEYRFQPAEQEIEMVLPISFVKGGKVIRCASPTAALEMTPLARSGLDRRAVQYPFPASPGRESGCVLLGFDVMENGLADGYEIVASDSVLPERFIAATVANANQWRFSCRVKTRSYAKFIYQGDTDSKTDTPVCSMPFPPTDSAPAPTP